MGQILGVGFVGAGSIARHHARVIQRLDTKAAIVAVADIYEDNARTMAEEFEARAYFNDYQEMLVRKDVDLVIVCTPPFEHCRVTVDALNEGKHVLCEKPMAGSLRECDLMIDAASRNKKFLAVGFQARHTRESHIAKALITSGKLGKVFFGKMDSFSWRGKSYYDRWWRGTWEQECGGVTLQSAIHPVDRLLWLMGQIPESVVAETGTFTHDVEVEDLSLVLLRFSDGARGVMSSASSLPYRQDRLEIGGTKAGFTLTSPSSNSRPWSVHVMKDEGEGLGSPDRVREEELKLWAENSVPETLDVDGIENQDMAWYLQDLDLLNAITEGRQPLVNGIEGRKSVEVILAVYKSAFTRERVKLPLKKTDPYYGKMSEIDR